MKISIIIPVYNEIDRLPTLLEQLAPAINSGHQVIVVDGGSTDDTCAGIADSRICVIKSTKGRSRQMNAGAAQASGDVLWFLHGDSNFLLPIDSYLVKLQQLGEMQWGRFNISISGSAVIYRVIENMMNLRSRLSGICTGDQGLFIHKSLFNSIGGFANVAIMEDIEICKRLKNICRPIIAREYLRTSSRRWERHGVWTTILLMWKMRLLYFMGVDTEKLARLYEQ